MSNIFVNYAVVRYSVGSEREWIVGYRLSIYLTIALNRWRNCRARGGNGTTSISKRFISMRRYSRTMDDFSFSLFLDDYRRFLTFMPTSNTRVSFSFSHSHWSCLCWLGDIVGEHAPVNRINTHNLSSERIEELKQTIVCCSVYLAPFSRD